MRLRVLGPIQVDGDDGPTRLRGQQAMLLAQLVAAFPAPVAFARLEDAFWGDSPPASPEAAMKVAVTRLRKTLGPDTVDHTPSGYQLLVDPDAIDHAVFISRADLARSDAAAGRFDAALEHAIAALDVWNGDAFASVADRLSLTATIQRLDEERAGVEDLLVDLLLAVGRYDEAAIEASRHTSELPLRERRWIQLMAALHLGGRTVEALRTFQQYRSMLADEVGLDPGESIVELEASLVAGDEITQWLAVRQGLAPDAELGDARSPSADLGRGTGLPPTFTSFVERPAELAALESAIGADRLVTVVGSAGIGKTRLIREWAGAIDGDRLCWVDLAVEVDSVTDAVADRLGVANLTGVAGAIRCLVLDNAENVAAKAAEAVEFLLAVDPALTIVVSSRTPLGMAGERVVRLGPMTQDAAAALLNARVNPAASLQDDDVAAILERTDGVPLAIEMLAVQASGAAVARMDRRDTSAPSPLAVRAGAMLDRLLEGDRRVFASLAPMRGSFDIDAVAHLCERSEGEAKAAINRLVASSFVERAESDVGSRYRVLQPMLEIAVDLARSTGQFNQFTSRHLAHYAAITVEREPQLYGVGEERAVAAMRRDLSQVRAAWRHAVETNDVDRAAMVAFGGWMYTLHGLVHRDYSMPFEVSQLPGFDVSPWRTDVLASAAMGEWLRGRRRRSIEAGEAAVAAADADDMPVPHHARFGLISSYGFDGRAEDAHAQIVSLIREARERESWFHLSGAQSQVAYSFALLGMNDEALNQSDAAMDSAERSDNSSTLSFAHHARALVVWDRAPVEALSSAYESLRLANRVKNRWLAGWTTASIGGLYRQLGRYEEAAVQFDGLIEHWQAVDMEPQLVHSVLESALVLDAVGDHPSARLALTIANEGRTSHGFMPADRERLAELRKRLPTPPPGEEESAMLTELRERLRSVAGIG